MHGDELSARHLAIHRSADPVERSAHREHLNDEAGDETEAGPPPAQRPLRNTGRALALGITARHLGLDHAPRTPQAAGDEDRQDLPDRIAAGTVVPHDQNPRPLRIGAQPSLSIVMKVHPSERARRALLRSVCVRIPPPPIVRLQILHALIDQGPASLSGRVPLFEAFSVSRGRLRLSRHRGTSVCVATSVCLASFVSSNFWRRGRLVANIRRYARASRLNTSPRKRGTNDSTQPRTNRAGTPWLTPRTGPTPQHAPRPSTAPAVRACSGATRRSHDATAGSIAPTRIRSNSGVEVSPVTMTPFGFTSSTSAYVPRRTRSFGSSCRHRIRSWEARACAGV